MAGHVAKLKFPCCLLPQTLRNGIDPLPDCSKKDPQQQLVEFRTELLEKIDNQQQVLQQQQKQLQQVQQQLEKQQ